MINGALCDIYIYLHPLGLLICRLTNLIHRCLDNFVYIVN